MRIRHPDYTLFNNMLEPINKIINKQELGTPFSIWRGKRGWHKRITFYNRVENTIIASMILYDLLQSENLFEYIPSKTISDAIAKLNKIILVYDDKRTEFIDSDMRMEEMITLRTELEKMYRRKPEWDKIEIKLTVINSSRRRRRKKKVKKG